MNKHKRNRRTVKRHVERILSESRRALHRTEILEKMYQAGWTSRSVTPLQTVAGVLSTHPYIDSHGDGYFSMGECKDLPAKLKSGTPNEDIEGLFYRARQIGCVSVSMEEVASWFGRAVFCESVRDGLLHHAADEFIIARTLSKQVVIIHKDAVVRYREGHEELTLESLKKQFGKR